VSINGNLPKHGRRNNPLNCIPVDTVAKTDTAELTRARNVHMKYHAPVQVIRAYGGAEVSFPLFVTSALAGSDWSASRPGGFVAGGST
jgi:hypothetical protein